MKVTGFVEPQIVTTVGGNNVRHSIAMIIQPFTGPDLNPTDRYYRASQLTRIYADPGSLVELHTNFGQTQITHATISGTLVPVP